MDKFRVLVTGGRFYGNADRVFEVLDEYNPDEVLQGGCPTGADLAARDWARWRERTCITVYAKWHTHNIAAGPVRNQQMLDEYCPDCVVAFPGGRGTQDMIHRAQAVGLDVAIVS